MLSSHEHTKPSSELRAPCFSWRVLPVSITWGFPGHVKEGESSSSSLSPSPVSVLTVSSLKATLPSTPARRGVTVIIPVPNLCSDPPHPSTGFLLGELSVLNFSVFQAGCLMPSHRGQKSLAKYLRTHSLTVAATAPSCPPTLEKCEQNDSHLTNRPRQQCRLM